MDRRHFIWRRSALLLLALLACVSGQEHDHDCSLQVQQARSELEARLAEESSNGAACQESHSRLLAAVERAQSDIAELKRAEHAKESQIADLLKQLEAEKNINAGHANSMEQLRSSFAARLSEAEAGHQTAAQKAKAEFDALVEELKAQIAAKANLDASDVWPALVAALRKSWVSTANEVQLVVKGLQQGNTAPLNAMFHKVTATSARAVRTAYLWLMRMLDEHLPTLQQKSAELYVKASQLYQKHVGDTAWGAEVKKQLSTTNKDLKVFLQGKVKSIPALKFLDDPVHLQLLTYGVFAAPLLLLFLPVLLWFATFFAPASKSSSASSSKSAKKKKSKPVKGIKVA